MTGDPLSLIVEASRRMSPTFLNYQIGSEIELILYHLLRRLKDLYDEVFVISFHDAYHFIVSYVSSVYPDGRDVFRPSHLISVNPYLEEALNPTMVIKVKDPEIIMGRIQSKLLSLDPDNGKRKLFIVLGLDLYGIRYREELVQIVPMISRMLAKEEGSNVLVTFNVRAFPETVSEIIDCFALNVFRFAVEVKKRTIRRKLTVIRSPFIEYNLRSWYYTVTKEGINFELAER
ncbi:hypothetical protein [Thermococcus sp.]|uniref:hypothetical protein n=1 Tax=Thermococcus sp. TaxID=35749 RepID=UPI002614D0D9|nr:hypothetical protein [Thermococcus sp.]